MKLKHRCLAVCVLLLAVWLALPATTTAQPGGGNSIQIAIDTSQKSKIIAVGSFSTAPNVTLDKVVVWAYASEGGVMPAQVEVGAAKIDNTKKTWGPGTIDTRVYKGAYAVRADGYFSDQSIVASGYLLQQVDGDQAPATTLTLLWSADYPKSTVSKKISCAGTYAGSPNADKKGELLATRVTGGPHSKTPLKMVEVVKGIGDWTGDPDITVPTSEMYSVIGAAADDGKDQKFYSTPYRVTQVAP